VMSGKQDAMHVSSRASRRRVFACLPASLADIMNGSREGIGWVEKPVNRLEFPAEGW
jgi:hypothetical protein